jgi:hypothetical protein
MNARDLATAAECSAAAVYKWQRQGKLPKPPYNGVHVATTKQLLANGRKTKAANVNQPLTDDTELASARLCSEDVEWLKLQPEGVSASIRQAVKEYRAKSN